MTVDATATDRLKQLHHDILNSLNVISLGAKALEESPTDLELLAYVCSNIEREQQRASELLRELIETASVSSDHQLDRKRNN